eukprot:757685-Hanusia_phi.AAC.1
MGGCAGGEEKNGEEGARIEQRREGEGREIGERRRRIGEVKKNLRRMIISEHRKPLHHRKLSPQLLRCN